MALDTVSSSAEANPSLHKNANSTAVDFSPETSLNIRDNSGAANLAASVWRDAQSAGTNTGNEVKLAQAANGILRDAGDILQSTDNSENGMVHLASTRGGLVSAIKASEGRENLGNRVPSNARKFANYRVPEHLQCASSISDLLISQGLMRPQDYKIRVRDLNPVLQRMFPSERLSGNFDLEDFPPGSKGFISGTGSSNHIGYFERTGDSVTIIHNKNGTMVKEDIKDKFYSESGRPKYGNMKIFRIR